MTLFSCIACHLKIEIAGETDYQCHEANALLFISVLYHPCSHLFQLFGVSCAVFLRLVVLQHLFFLKACFFGARMSVLTLEIEYVNDRKQKGRERQQCLRLQSASN